MTCRLNCNSRSIYSTRSKKTRCTGRHPCILCVKLGLACTFNASYTRGRLPSVISDIGLLDEQAVQNQGHSSFPIVDHAQSDCVPNVEPMSYPSPASVEQARSNRANYLEPQKQRLSSGGPSSRTSPEPEASQTDRQGHYVGPASGVSFLLRLQKKLVLQKTTSSSNSSIFTFGDASLPEFDPHFFILPAKNEAQHMVARYFDFAVPTHRFLHRPTIETWLEEFYDNVGVMKQKDGAHERIAMLFMIFAMAKEYMSIPSADSADISARYFQAAEQQLNAARGEIQLTSVQTRLCQCFYLLAQSRINHCWSLFGTTTHLAYAIGIHRRRRVDSTTDLVDLECRKRVFWCAYSLDNYLSTALGRPRTFHDDDIDQVLVLCDLVSL